MNLAFTSLAFVEGKSKSSDSEVGPSHFSSGPPPVLKCRFYYYASMARPADQEMTAIKKTVWGIPWWSSG